jgi:lipid II:glycine glycyltransferase (peptidoglycan interpeptide bridge formation enzyme)
MRREVDDMPPSVTQNTGLPYTTGRYTVVEKEGVSRSQWDGWVEDSPGGGHILQSHEWGELRRGMGWRPVRLLFEEDGQIAGVGQFLVYNTPLVPDTLMFCPKGPWLPWDNEEAVQAFFEGVLAVAKREGAHTVKIEPEVLEQQTRVKELLSEIGFHRLGRDFNYKTTILLDLSPSEDEILAGMKKKTRQNIRIAERKGVRVVEDNSPEALEDVRAGGGAQRLLA